MSTKMFRRGDRVYKIRGSQWSGTIVGEYSTELTPEGYAVESDTEKGSVQIYPAKALKLVENATREDYVQRKYVLGAAHPSLALYRIVAVRDFGDVACGDIGGWVSSEENLSHNGNCWIFDDATSCFNAVVSESATLHGKAVAGGHAKVKGHAKLFDTVFVKGNATIDDYAEIYGSSKISALCEIFGHAKIFDCVEISGTTKVCGSTVISGGVQLHDNCIISGDANLTSDIPE